MRRPTSISACVLIVGTCVAASAVAQTQDRLYRPGFNRDNVHFSDSDVFTVVGLPDTQNYSQSYPQIFADQTRWVVNNRYRENIRFVSHYGDVVQNGDRLNEWANARFAMDPLINSGIPMGVVAGNHDVTRSGISGQPYIPQNYLKNFGPQRFDGRSWFGGASPSGMSTYQTFEGGGREFLALHINVDTPVSELAWAQGVVNANRDKPVMITTHRYLQDVEDYIPDGLEGITDLVVQSGRYPDIWYAVEGTYHPDGIHAQEFFDTFVRTNANVFMVNAGHFHEEYRQTSTNIRGAPVHEVLADYQDDPNGGNGWLRLMQFDPRNNRINVESYSPWLDEYRSADESRFTLDVEFDRYGSRDPVAVFQQGINGYDGTIDTWVNEADKNRAYGLNDRLVVDDDTENAWFSDDRGQGLIRFDKIFNDEGGVVPRGAEVLSAQLRFHIAEDIDTPFYDPDFEVYMMTEDWDEDSTWNSLGDGAGDDRGLLIGMFEGDNDPNGDGLRFLDVTLAMQMWSDGDAENHGFVLLPEIISGNDDGIAIWSSEYWNPLLRPVLEVTWAGDTRFVPAPGAGALLLLAGVAASARRRRNVRTPAIGSGMS